MSNRFESGYVLPKPQIPKLVGGFNVVFGSLLFLFALGTIGLAVFSPAIVKMAQGTAANAQIAQEKARQDSIDDLKKQEASAATAEEKDAARKQREDLESQPAPKRPMISMNVSGQVGDDPLRTAVFWVEIVLSLVLNALMVVSGVGLVMLKDWARRLALWDYALKIARLVALCAVTTGVLAPRGAKAFRDGYVAEQAKGGGNEAEARRAATQTAQTIVVAGTVYSVGTLVLGAVYPAVAFGLLLTRGAWAACRPVSPSQKPSARLPAAGGSPPP